jgi:hypothetical protein
MAGGKIFINYRREDSRGEARALFDRLNARFPRQVFIDVSALDPGQDFVQAIEDEVGSCDVFLVVMGNRWLAATDVAGQRRLDDPQDFVRLEIATALKRGIPVIPALVGGAPMPLVGDLPIDLQGLTRRNAISLTDQGWDDDVMRLIRALERILLPAKKEEKAPRWRYWPRLIAAGALLACLLVLAKLYWTARPEGQDSQIKSKLEHGTAKPVADPPSSSAVSPPAGDGISRPKKVTPKITDTAIVGLWHVAYVVKGGKKMGKDIGLGEDGGLYGDRPGKWELFAGDKRRLVLDTSNDSGARFSCDLAAENDQGKAFIGPCKPADGGSGWTWELTR